jgi:hypothetical protein
VADLASLLDREVTVLAERLRGWSASRWNASGRAETAFRLATRFAELAGAPVQLPWMGAHVLADQIALTGHELVLTHPGDDVLAAALDELRRTREALGL